MKLRSMFFYTSNYSYIVFLDRSLECLSRAQLDYILHQVQTAQLISISSVLEF